MVYKGLNDLSPEYITDLFVKTSEVHSIEICDQMTMEN